MDSIDSLLPEQYALLKILQELLVNLTKKEDNMSQQEGSEADTATSYLANLKKEVRFKIWQDQDRDR